MHLLCAVSLRSYGGRVQTTGYRDEEGFMTSSGDVGTEIAPEVDDDPALGARLDDLLHRACSLACALTALSAARPAEYANRA